MHSELGDAMVYIVDDDASVRKALTRIFKSHGLQAESFASAQEFLAYQRADVPACLILDYQMPGQTGIELQAELATQQIELPIIFLTAHGDIEITVEAMRGGAINFLPKPVDEQKLLEIVREAIQEDASQQEVKAELREFRQRIETLTKREYEVMAEVITGKLNKQIASVLGITEYTVKVHRGRVMEKTCSDSLAELVRYCERCGIGSGDS